MSPAELATALDRRFEVLAGGRRGAVKRQQTLRATIDWSYDLLDESQQRLLARLAVFAGGCTRDAAEAVCAGEPIEARAVFGLLAGLVDRSLVVAERGGLDTRYRLLETIREYGEERLAERDETDALRDRHARYYADYAQRCYEGCGGSEQIEWGTRMLVDGDNILAAFAHAIDTRDFDLAVKLLEWTSLVEVMQTGLSVMRGPSRRRRSSPWPAWNNIRVTRSFSWPPAFSAETRGEATLALEYGDAALEAERALTVPRPYSVDLSASRYSLAGMVAISTGAWDEAAAAFLEAAELERRADRMGWVATRLGSAASALCYGGRFADAVPVATEGLGIARATGMQVTITTNLVALAQALCHQDPERARALLEEASHTALEYESWAELTQMTLAAAMLSDWPLTARFATRSIRHLHWVNHRPYLAGILNVAARALSDTDPEAAATIQGAAHDLVVTAATKTAPASAGSGRAPTDNTHRTGLIVETRRDTTRRLIDTLGDERLRTLRDHGAAMDTDTAVAYTLSRLDAFLTNTDD